MFRKITANSRRPLRARPEKQELRRSSAVLPNALPGNNKRLDNTEQKLNRCPAYCQRPRRINNSFGLRPGRGK
eukprot:11480853-Alexandrium_andersonii.AAC.1